MRIPPNVLKLQMTYKKPEVSLENFFAAPKNIRIRKVLEASKVVLKRPSLKKPTESKKLLLFCKGVSWKFYNF